MSYTLRLTTLLVATLGLFAQQCTAGYTIMDDCSSDQRALLEEAFSNIGGLVDVAKRYNTAETSDAGKELFQRLFGEQPGSGLMSQSVDQTLTGIAENAIAVDGEPQGGDSSTADVMVYCSLDRLIKKTGENGEDQLWDPSIRHWLKNKWDCTGATAYVAVPDKDLSKPDVMQICPWYLDFLMSVDLRYQSKWDKDTFHRLVKNLGTKIVEWKYAQVDLLSLAEKVIIHELTHTRRGKKRDDPRGFGSYGWKNCREMSTLRGVKDAPQNNADTYALFVSAANIIEEGGAISDEGSLSEAVSAASRRLKRRHSAAF